MAFNIYDPKGFRQPYHPESKWRDIRAPQETQPYTETKREKEKEEQEEQQREQELEKDIIEEGKIQKRAPVPAREEGVIYASQIMKRSVVTLSPETTLPEAWKVIHDHRFRHVPVVNDEGLLVGILSDRTILKEAAPFGKHPDHPFEEIQVKEIMSVPVLTAHPETDISHIAKIFINEKIGAMPVIDEKHKIVGILTRSDILRTIVKVELFELRI